MKKFFALSLIAIMIFCLCACKKQHTDEDPKDSDISDIDVTESSIDADTTVDPDITTEIITTTNISTTTAVATENPKTPETIPQNNSVVTTTASAQQVNKVEPSVPAHIHAFSSPTCTEPSKCECGATNGSPLGHTWKEASCMAPKTCTVCGITEGDKLPHNISDSASKCTMCGEFGYNVNYALRQLMKQKNEIDGNYFDLYRIRGVYYVENKPCICGETHTENYLTVFVDYYYEKDGRSGLYFDTYDIHKEGDDHYTNYFVDIEFLVTEDQQTEEVVKVRTNDYSIYYDANDLVKADLGKILK